jgi:hypothetical protein
LDANNNGTLDVGEINATLTKYVCNGATGATGLQGPAGVAGAQGPIGLTGPQGAQGIQGQVGATGATGLTGPQGPQGVAGTTGLQGPAGTAGTNGTNGQNTLVRTTTESAGANCTTGGVKIEYGLDANSNGILEAGEVNATLTKYVCNGAIGSSGSTGPQGPIGATGLTGPQGPQGVAGTTGLQGPAGTAGTNGTNGQNTLVKTTNESAGANCTTGGVKIEYGLDVNSNGNLDAGEINATLTKYVCNGAVGSTGATGSQGAQGPIGLTGATGLTGPQGAAGPTGAQGPQGIAGTTGLQGPAGAAGTNGTNGQNTLVRTTTESAGANCTTGGVKIEYGLDANSNGILEVGEVNATLTKYVCNGAIGASGSTGPQGTVGPAGAQGPQGVNGLNALIKTTAEPAGANCANGGTKIETGLDANTNGVLDASEVNASQTQYVCNGAGSAGGSGLPFSNIQVYSTPGTFTWTCPTGVTRIMVELWGAGGGGAGAGGQGGGYGKSFINVTQNNQYIIIIGAGGCTTHNVSGCVIGANPGGDTSFGGIIAYGGNGGGGNIANKGTSNATLSVNGGSNLMYYNGGSTFGGGASFQGSPTGIRQNGRPPGGGGGGDNPGCTFQSTCGGNGLLIINY